MFSTVRLRAVSTLVFAGLFGTLAYFFGVQSTLGQQLESAALATTVLNYNPGFPLSLVSPMFVTIAISILALLGAVRGGLQAFCVIVLASGSAIFLSQLLKHDVLTRPNLMFINAQNSFPSGHATVFAVLAFGLITVLPPLIRVFISSILALALTIIGAQIFLNGWHRPSDILGAYMLALFCYGVCFALMPVRRRSMPVAAAIPAFIFGLLTGLIALAAIIVSVYAWFSGVNEAASWAGIFVIAGASFFCVHAILRILK